MNNEVKTVVNQAVMLRQDRAEFPAVRYYRHHVSICWVPRPHAESSDELAEADALTAAMDATLSKFFGMNLTLVTIVDDPQDPMRAIRSVGEIERILDIKLGPDSSQR